MGEAVSADQHRGRPRQRTIGTAGSKAQLRSWARRSNWSATTCSSPTSKRLQKGIDLKAANSILVKVNQIGKPQRDYPPPSSWHKRAGYTAVISHRSGETEDAFIADLAVATGAGQIKTGSRLSLGPYRQIQPATAHRGLSRRPRPSTRDATPFATRRSSRDSARGRLTPVLGTTRQYAKIRSRRN